MSLVEEVTVVAAKFKSFQKTITIFIFLNQRQNLGIIISLHFCHHQHHHHHYYLDYNAIKAL